MSFDNNLNVLVIGSGNLGMRHVQALGSVNHELTILVVEPNISAIKRTKSILNELDNNSADISFYRKLEEVKTKSFFLVIIATTSIERKDVCKKILESFSVKFILLEKILFANESDYYEISELISKCEVDVFVNCSMRTMPSYLQIKNYFDNSSIEYHVNGGNQSNYGLITCLPHHLDHIGYLTGDHDIIDVDTTHLLNPPIQSKRKNYLEFTGLLIVRFKGGTIGTFHSYEKSAKPLTVNIENRDVSLFICEQQKRMILRSRSDEWKISMQDFPVAYQSEMTKLIVEDLILHQRCELPSYDLAMRTHLSFLMPMKEWLSKNNVVTEVDFPFT